MRVLLASCCVALVACTGSLETRPAGPTGTGRVPACADGACAELPAPASRLPRLSHPQYENTVRDLLALPAAPGLTDTFLGDASSTLFDNNGGELSVGDSLWLDYQRGAETLAERVTTAPDALSAIVLPSERGDVRAFITRFGRRAHRRPLTPEDVDGYAALAASGPGAYPGMDPFDAQVRVVLEAMLQSPSFLYRVELSSTAVAGGGGEVIQPTDDELASRLSYALWDTMPDEALFAAAAEGRLRTAEGLRAEATRMLQDPKARATVANFHTQWLSLQSVLDVTRSTMVFPEFDPALPRSMVDETQAFIAAVVFEDGGGFADLVTAPFSFADARLAGVYGLEGGFDETMRRVDLDPTERSGLLTHAGFLAVNSSATEPDAIHRGVFVNRRILCAPLPPPPMVVPPIPADATGTSTMRERIDRHTGPGTCGAGCHSVFINPIGFAFEHYDALGRFRQTDQGRPVDATGTYSFDGTPTDFDGAVALGTAIAETTSAHVCYARHWAEYAFGRPPASQDAPLLARLGQASQDGTLSVTGLLVELVSSDSFRFRSTTELED